MISLLTLVACTPYNAEDTGYAFHGGFDRGTAHEALPCEACHVLAASQQLASPNTDVPEFDSQGWIIPLHPGCASCHPLVAELGAIPDELECNTLGTPVYDHEYCKFKRYHRANPGGCSGAEGQSCHSVDHAVFAFYSGPIDTGDTDAPTPPQNPHTLGTLVDVFPLEGAHVGIACANALCHPNGTADTSDVVGKSEYCGSCHGRVADGASGGATHWPAARITADERERDCMACHVNVQQDGSVIYPNAWTDVQTRHHTLVPHNTVDDWDSTATPKNENAWKRQCWSCHNVSSALGSPVNPIDNDLGTSQDGIPLLLDVDTNAPTTRGNCTDSCHQDYNGPISLHNNPGGGPGASSCYGSGCHTTTGPDDGVLPP